MSPGLLVLAFRPRWNGETGHPAVSPFRSTDAVAAARAPHFEAAGPWDRHGLSAHACGGGFDPGYCGYYGRFVGFRDWQGGIGGALQHALACHREVSAQVLDLFGAGEGHV